MKYATAMKSWTFTFLALRAISTDAQATTTTCPQLSWADEFDGTSLDQAKWQYQIGDGGWGNGELQYYDEESVVVSNGALTIHAGRVLDDGAEHYRYHSGRIRTYQKAAFTYGLFEGRIKITETQGFWPAFWMLPENFKYGIWPLSGEIDIMENIGKEPHSVHGTIHFGDLWPNNQHSGQQVDLVPPDKFADDYHVFAVERRPNEIVWLLDGAEYSRRTPSDIAPHFWPFEERFHFLLNVAIGGYWPGNPDDTSVFPQQMNVDYVRVYDSTFGYLNGPRSVEFKAKNVKFSVMDGIEDYTYSWSVPPGATITSAPDGPSIDVDFGSSSGLVSVTVASAACTVERTFTIPIEVKPGNEAEPDPNYVFDTILLDGETGDKATFLSTSSLSYDLSLVNPLPDDVNDSNRVVQYTRSTYQYDAIFFATSAITSPSEYSTKAKRFYMDVYSPDAPAGAVILLQLENSVRADSANYPMGRHSRYQAKLPAEASTKWCRLAFGYVDSPDVGEVLVDTIVILFAPDTFQSHTYYFDNISSYKTLQTNEPERMQKDEPDQGKFQYVYDLTFESAEAESTEDRGAFMSSLGKSIDFSFTNPIPNNINESPTVVKYIRSNLPFDNINYSTAAIDAPDDFSSGSKLFFLDIFSPDAPAGTVALIHLENSARAMTSNYPVGRHSRYQAILNESPASGWHRLEFAYIDSPDSSEDTVNSIVLLLAPGSTISRTFFFDNLDSYKLRLTLQGRDLRRNGHL